MAAGGARGDGQRGLGRDGRLRRIGEAGTPAFACFALACAFLFGAFAREL